jgi:hypothetical protein
MFNLSCYKPRLSLCLFHQPKQSRGRNRTTRRGGQRGMQGERMVARVTPNPIHTQPSQTDSWAGAAVDRSWGTRERDGERGGAAWRVYRGRYTAKHPHLLCEHYARTLPFTLSLPPSLCTQCGIKHLLCPPSLSVTR